MSEHFEEPEEADDPWDYTPPDVKWVPIKTRTGNSITLPTGEQVDEEKVTGFRIDPPFGLDWPHLKTLQHFAALIEHRTGLKVRVIEATPEQDQTPEHPDYIPATYEVRTDHVVGQAAPYEVAYAWLSGYENGAHAILWKASQDSK